MVRKRLIGVVTALDNFAVQSFGYERYLPLGDILHLVENLDRWGIDEILVQSINRTKDNLGPDFELLEQLGKIRLTTPLIYSGGIRDADDAVQVISKGADRIACDALFRNQPEEIINISNKLGRQCVIGSLPVRNVDSKLIAFDYLNKIETNLSDQTLSLINNRIISELIIIDYMNEGIPGSFDNKLIKNIHKFGVNIILFGGIGDGSHIEKLVMHEKVSAIAVGNYLNYKEDSVHLIKKQLSRKFRQG